MSGISEGKPSHLDRAQQSWLPVAVHALLRCHSYCHFNLGIVLQCALGRSTIFAPMAPPKPHILHVDDNEDDRLLFQWAFIKSGIQGILHSVVGAADAMRYLNQSDKSSDAPRPKLIFLDLSLPRFDGLDLLELLREHSSFRTIPVIILSGSESHANQQRCRDLGVQDYIVKPQNQQELAELIASLEHWLVGSSSGLPTPKANP